MKASKRNVGKIVEILHRLFALLFYIQIGSTKKSILLGYSFLITFAETVKDALQFFIAAAFVSTVQNFVLLLCREAYKRDIADEIDSA